VIVLAVALLGGCSSGGGKHAASTRTTSSVPSAPVSVDDGSNGATVLVQPGQTLIVTLHSTYWQLSPPPGSTPLRVQAPPTPQTRTGCPSIPGTGCGTVSATYVATGPGTTTVTAHRDSCGEALRCVGEQGNWRITVRVP
jgi:hypothetical protein